MLLAGNPENASVWSRLSHATGRRNGRTGVPKGGLTATVLFAVAGLHVLWGFGSSFPYRSREELADSVVGTDTVPPRIACIGVAAALALAGVLVVDVVPLPRGVRGVVLRGGASVLALRGVAGAMGQTAMLSPGSNAATFVRQDKRVYSPLCLWLAAGLRRAASLS